jgi:hypothetical protein
MIFRRGPSYPRKDCSLCKTMRLFIAMAVLVLALASFAFDFEGLKHIEFTDFFAYLVGVGFVATIAWRIWAEYLRKSSRPPKSDR